MLKLAMIGSRGHFNYVFMDIEALKKMADITCISSGCEDPVDRLKDRCAEFGFQPEIYADWKEMLETEKPDVVCVDGPFEKHAEMSAFALRKGIHVFCEKPIALTYEQLDLVKDALKVSKARIISMVGIRYMTPFYQAAEMVHSGAIGKIKLIRTQKSYKLATRPAFYSRRETYGGTIGWVGSHALDWVMYFTKDKFESVSALQTSEDNFGNGEMEIAASCQLKMKSGIIVNATMEFLRPMSAPTWGDDRIRLAGTEGVLEIRDEKIYLIDKDGSRVIEPEDTGMNIFADFLGELSGGKPAVVTTEETIELTNACLKAQEAADTGKIIYF